MPQLLLPGKGPPECNCMGDWVGPRAILDAVEKRKFSRTCWDSNLFTLFIQAIAHVLYQLSCVGSQRSESKMKERILDKYMVSSGRLLCMVLTFGFHKDKELPDQGKITINFSRNIVYCGVSVWVNETFWLMDKMKDRHISTSCSYLYMFCTKNA
jgi:hypothetical protein